MPNQLDYNADTAGLFNPRAPFSVNVDPNKPPGDRFKDYIPKNSPAQTTRADNNIRQKSFMRPPVARYEEDFISGADSEVKRRNDKLRIVELAKEIYAGEKTKRLAFQGAQATVEKGIEGPELEKAKKILQRTPPLTKEQAMEKAAQQFYGLRS